MDAGLGDRPQPDPAAWHHHGLNRILYRYGDILDTPDQVISLQSRAVALAVINAIGNVGSAVSPLLIGILRDTTGSFSSGLWFVAGLLVVGALVLTRIPMTQRDQQRNDHVPEPYRQH
jgi:ACS family 4-hydroxyphenylacetate permease-like MFS transporter